MRNLILFNKPTKFTNWHSLPWKDIINKVKDLQNEIVKATQDNNMNLVYKLQRQLVTSIEGRALAIRNVVTNSGGKTPGVDNILWKTPKDRFQAIEELGAITKNPNSYRSSPLLRVMIPKPYSDEKRPLGIPTLIDRAVQAVYYLAVDPVVETTSDKYSFGFRKGRSPHDAIAYIRSWLDKNYSPEYILETDISKCFDKISHTHIMKTTPICDKQVLLQWLKSGFKLENKFYPTDAGTPQGGIISPMLCNAALNGLENAIRKEFPLKIIKGERSKIYIIRFADDIVVTGAKENDLIRVKQLIVEYLKVRDLEMKESKTRIIHIKQGFDFLGFNISRKTFNPKLNKDTKQETVLIIKPSTKAVQNIATKIKEVTRTKNEMVALIKELNPIIRGWGNYFRISYHSQETFITVGHILWQTMMSWVRRNNPYGSLRKNVLKYLVTENTRSRHTWTWGIKEKVINWNKENKLTIINPSEISPITHPLLKMDKNPYLKENAEYFNKRSIEMIEAKFRREIYKLANHLCPKCGESLHNGEPIELHHIVPVKAKGKYTLKNIQPLHRICHQSITHKTKDEEAIEID